MSSQTTSHFTADGNPIVRMFTWWNQAFFDKDGYTPDAFSAHYTDDAVLIKNGDVRGEGVEELAEHYRKLQGKFDKIEMLLPVIDQFQVGDRAFVHCVTKAVHGDDIFLEEAMAVATMINNRISRLVIIGRSISETA